MTIRSDSFMCMRRLQSLKLNYNHWEIKNHTGVFSKLVSIEKLELQNSFLPLVNSTEHMKQLGETFKEAKMPELRELHMERNNIKHITADDFHVFCPLRNLKKLYLSHNFISHPGIDPSCAENLDELHLDNNSIPFLSDVMIKVVEDLPELTLINITDNPFVCDCQVDNFYHFLKSTILLLDVEGLKCVAGYPVSNVGHKIVDLHVTDFRSTNKEGPSNPPGSTTSPREHPLAAGNERFWEITDKS
ncbi:amphoterin-induced protein 2-like [Lineus longissimus]|uniref:amphoterin-induced protein 2-like n=1 Tax=Lineus longissimus TaxID=88925 RepID=UPI00315D2F1D